MVGWPTSPRHGALPKERSDAKSSTSDTPGFIPAAPDDGAYLSASPVWPVAGCRACCLMIDRYGSSQIHVLWSDHYKYGIWADIEAQILQAQARAAVIPASWALQVEDRPAPSAAEVARATEQTHHEMVGFLLAWGVEHVHIGVTSSDIIDLEQTMRISSSASHLDHLVEDLCALLMSRARAGQGHRSVARTHGQDAQSCPANHLDIEHLSQLIRARHDLAYHTLRVVDNAKLRGPTGNYAPPAITPAIERDVLEHFGMMPAPSATQLAPRDVMVSWAQAVAAVARACHRIALQIRLDVQTGAGAAVLAPSGMGSSSMPHKTNPVQAEQACGLAGVVSALAHSLEPIALTWGHRDLTNSSVERVVLPQIVAYTEQVLNSTLSALKRTRPLPGDYHAPDSHSRMMLAQLQGVPYFEARSHRVSESPDLIQPVDWTSSLIRE